MSATMDVRQQATSIDTRHVAGRRTLHFASLDDLLADVAGLAEADRAGRLKRLGNWTLGQALGHLAGWIEFAYTGAPLRPPFFIRWILRLRRNSFIKGPMRSGVHIPGVDGGTLETAILPTDQALARLRSAVERLRAEPPRAPSPAVGPMTHEEAISLNLRHAELHLSFFVPS